MHFTPTSSSWLNLIKRWFRELTDNALRRGAFHSVPDLIAKIEEYLDGRCCVDRLIRGRGCVASVVGWIQRQCARSANAA
jgi:hypothetical protein